MEGKGYGMQTWQMRQEEEFHANLTSNNAEQCNMIII
jgi:hypothetical protein